MLRPCCIFSKTKPVLASILVTPDQAGHLAEANVLGTGLVAPSIARRATSFDTPNICKALSNLRFAWRRRATRPQSSNAGLAADHPQRVKLFDGHQSTLPISIAQKRRINPFLHLPASHDEDYCQAF